MAGYLTLPCTSEVTPIEKYFSVAAKRRRVLGCFYLCAHGVRSDRLQVEKVCSPAERADGRLAGGVTHRSADGRKLDVLAGGSARLEDDLMVVVGVCVWDRCLVLVVTRASSLACSTR